MCCPSNIWSEINLYVGLCCSRKWEREQPFAKIRRSKQATGCRRGEECRPAVWHRPVADSTVLQFSGSRHVSIDDPHLMGPRRKQTAVSGNATWPTWKIMNCPLLSNLPLLALLHNSRNFSGSFGFKKQESSKWLCGYLNTHHIVSRSDWRSSGKWDGRTRERGRMHTYSISKLPGVHEGHLILQCWGSALLFDTFPIKT